MILLCLVLTVPSYAFTVNVDDNEVAQSELVGVTAVYFDDTVAKKEEDTTVALKIMNNPGLSRLTVTVDAPFAVQIKSVTGLGGLTARIDGTKIYISSASEILGDVSLANIVFTVYEAGQFTVKLSATGYDDESNQIKIPIAKCSISTKSVLIGDVNNDGEVDAVDLTRLKKYLAGQPVEIFEGANTNPDVDNVVDAVDLTRLKKLLAGIDIFQ